MSEKENVKKTIEKLGYKIVYVPHGVIENYNACYKVVYKGRTFSPPAADKLGIPLNEIWISQKWKEFDKHILYHELREIEYRSRGYNMEQAHKLANKDVKEKFRGKPKHERLLRAINI
ncbi:MAG: hypothetical protein GWO20_05045, partial [Candidatus Korarchaeota archaeon]|nr:hypothetical protein [Candidatus Korarchaeota archaeon]